MSSARLKNCEIKILPQRAIAQMQQKEFYPTQGKENRQMLVAIHEKERRKSRLKMHNV